MRPLGIFCLSLICATLAQNAYADVSQEEEAVSWGYPQALALAKEAEKAYPDSFPVSCHADFKQVSIDLTGYVLHISSHFHVGLPRVIPHLLSSLYKSHDPCFAPTSIYYAAAALAILESTNSGGMCVGCQSHYADLTIYFFAHGLLKPLTPKLRLNLGGMWTMLLPRDDGYRYYGFYDCARSTYFYDPFREPIDVASGLLHELSHLIRDKDDPQYSVWNTLTPEEAVFVDELVATLHAGYFEARLTKQPSPWQAPAADMTLFHKNGYLSQILDQESAHRSGLWQYFGQFSSSWFLTPSQALENLLFPIYQAVSRGYFGADLDGLPGFSEKLKKSSARTVDPLSYYISVAGGVGPGNPETGPVDFNLPIFKELEARLSEQSNACYQFAAASRDHKLGDYVGQAGRSGRKGGEGVGGGDSLTSPGQTGAFPCRYLEKL